VRQRSAAAGLTDAEHESASAATTASSSASSASEYGGHGRGHNIERTQPKRQAPDRVERRIDRLAAEWLGLHARTPGKR